MPDSSDKDYVVIVQCHLVKQRCSGYQCEKAFHERRGGFSGFAADRAYRTLTMTCGGCCGRALQRKLSHLVRTIEKREGLDKDRIVVQLASCIAKESHHGPVCPHLDYLRSLIARLGLDVIDGTHVSEHAEQLRSTGVYKAEN